MVVPESGINNIMGGLESAAGVQLHNHRRKLRQRFDIVRKLGQGTYGKVQLGINKETGQEVAIKTIKKCKIETEADLIRIRREIQIMSSVRHPNIIHIYEVFENQDKMVLVMEYAAGGELYDYLNERKVLTEEEARRIFRQIATAIYYCHKHKICHRDLKLENILLDENGSAKIADFGLSNVFAESRLLTTFCGSPLYASPEIVKGIPYNGPEVDCWSLGVLLYTLVYGAMPFDGSNFKRLVRQISQGDYFEPKNPSPASPLIRNMLSVNPGHRADIISICSHWWVDQTYSDACLDIAEHLANQTPVRLDLLLSLVPSVSSEKIVVGDIQVDPNTSERIVRSQSLGSIPPVRLNTQLAPLSVSPKDAASGPLAEKSGSAEEKSKSKTKTKRERSSSRSRKKESSTSVDSDADGVKPKKKSAKKEKTPPVQHESLECDTESLEKLKENVRLINESLKEGSDITEAVEDPEKYSLDVKVAPLCDVPKTEPEEKNRKQDPLVEKNDNEQNADKSKLSERRRSKVFETAEKLTSIQETQIKQPTKKIFLPGVKVGDAKRAFERKSSLADSQSNLVQTSGSRKSFSNKSKSPSPTVNEKKYSLASTINLNKLAESALKKSSDEIVPPISSADVSQTSPVPKANAEPSSSINKKLPEKVSKKPSESTPVLKKSSEEVPEVSEVSPDRVSNEISETPLSKSSSVSTTSNDLSDEARQTKVRNAVKVISHAISIDGENKAATIPRRKTSRAEIVLAPPNKGFSSKVPEYKSEVEHFVNEPEAPQKAQVTIPIAAPTISKPVSRPASQPREHVIPIKFEEEVTKVSTPPSSRASLSKQSTFNDSDSQLSVSSSGDPIRKSPREVIIPIAVEGGGYVTPADTMSRISSLDEVEEETPRCFTLHSTRHRHGHSDRIESTDSISSDEDDDNFEILTAENLFSTLLSRVRSLTHKLSTEDGAHQAFPRSFFTQHHSLFDSLPSRRLAGTRSFARSDSAPWRRRNITSVPSGIPETYSMRRLSQDNERATGFNDKPPLYKSKSNLPSSKPFYHSSLSNSTSSSSGFMNQYTNKHDIDEHETPNSNRTGQDSFKRGSHRHSFHGTGFDYSDAYIDKLCDNFKIDNLKTNDLNLPIIPEALNVSSKLSAAALKYLQNKASARSDKSPSSSTRFNSESKINENSTAQSQYLKNQQSFSTGLSDANRGSRIPTFQRSTSLNPETSNRRQFQRSLSVTPDRSISGSKFSASNNSKESTLTQQLSPYTSRYSRFLPSVSDTSHPLFSSVLYDNAHRPSRYSSIRETPERKLASSTRSDRKPLISNELDEILKNKSIERLNCLRETPERKFPHTANIFSKISNHNQETEPSEKKSFESSENSDRTLHLIRAETPGKELSPEKKLSEIRESNEETSRYSHSQTKPVRKSSSACYNGDKLLRHNDVRQTPERQLSDKSLNYDIVPGHSGSCVNLDSGNKQPEVTKLDQKITNYRSSPIKERSLAESRNNDEAMKTNCIRQTPERRLPRNLPLSDRVSTFNSSRRSSISKLSENSLSRGPKLCDNSQISDKSQDVKALKYRRYGTSSSASSLQLPSSDSKSQICRLAYSSSSSNCSNLNKERKSLIKSNSMDRLSVNPAKPVATKVSADPSVSLATKGRGSSEVSKTLKPNAHVWSSTSGASSSRNQLTFLRKSNSFSSNNRQQNVKFPCPKPRPSSESNNVSSASKTAVPHLNNSSQSDMHAKTLEKDLISKKLSGDSSMKTLPSNVSSTSSSTVDSNAEELITKESVNSSNSGQKNLVVNPSNSKSVQVSNGAENSTDLSLSSTTENCNLELSIKDSKSFSEMTDSCPINRSSCSNNDESIASSEVPSISMFDEESSRKKSEMNVTNGRSKSRFDLQNNNFSDTQEFILPKPPKKRIESLESGCSSSKSKFKVSPVPNSNINNVDCYFTAKDPRKVEKKNEKSSVHEISLPDSLSRLRRFSEVGAGKNYRNTLDANCNELRDVKAGDANNYFPCRSNNKPNLNYNFHRKLTSSSNKDKTGGNWIQDLTTSKYLNSHLRRSPTESSPSKNYDNGHGFRTPVRSSSSSYIKKDLGGSSKSNEHRSDLKLNIPAIMYTSEISSYDESSSVISPTEDGSDSWSASSDYADAYDSLPPNGRSHSCPTGPEDSVSDRIRRKSFYSRFNPSISSRKFLNSNVNFSLRPSSRLPTYSRSFSSDMSQSLRSSQL